MASLSSTRAPAAFELKSAALTLLSVVLKTADLAVLAQELEAQTADAPGLFDQDPVAIDLSQLRDADEAVDFQTLIQVLQSHSLRPIAARAGSAAQMAAALAAGLAEAPDGAPAAAPRSRPSAVLEVVGSVKALAPAAAVVEAPAVAETGAPSAPVAVPTLIVDRPLRSGQQVYARGGDLVVLAVVNHGAEVIADGSIHVYAPLRGRAVAGARGDSQARIYSTCMEPQLVSIAGTYRTIETALPADVLGKPAMVRLDGERLVIEALKS